MCVSIISAIWVFVCASLDIYTWKKCQGKNGIKIKVEKTMNDIANEEENERAKEPIRIIPVFDCVTRPYSLYLQVYYAAWCECACVYCNHSACVWTNENDINIHRYMATAHRWIVCECVARIIERTNLSHIDSKIQLIDDLFCVLVSSLLLRWQQYGFDIWSTSIHSIFVLFFGPFFNFNDLVVSGNCRDQFTIWTESKKKFYVYYSSFSLGFLDWFQLIFGYFLLKIFKWTIQVKKSVKRHKKPY